VDRQVVELTCHHGRVTFSVLVEVRLRPGIADPQGATIERSLPMLGFDAVTGVAVGKAIRFTVDAPDESAARAQVDDLCHRFLTNPVIEDAIISLEPVSLEPVLPGPVSAEDASP
jgi:phosphoribosylformylglycinamidine synthase subunit PurS